MRQYGVESYLGVPLYKRDGTVFGTLCALDRAPVLLSADSCDLLRTTASLIAFELEEHERQFRRDADMREARATTERCERFLAIVAHDLRNPLSAILTSAKMAGRNRESPHRVAKYVHQISTSGERVKRLVSELLDLARTRLGAGLSITRAPTDLGVLCVNIVSEFIAANPAHDITLNISDNVAGFWDGDRLMQAISNIVGNAIIHGASNGPVRIGVTDLGDVVEVEVVNTGKAIAPEILGKIFDPYRRGALASERQPSGLGLGLYIVQQIAVAHNGAAYIRSDETETVVTLRLPRL